MASLLRRKETSLILIGISFFIVTGVYFFNIPTFNAFAGNLVLMVSVLNAMSILLALYMASACARAFRARSPQATMLLISGIIVLMGQAPLTGVFAPFLGTAGTYLTSSFAMAASRVFTMSVTIGAVVL